jgi:hypothetical protein
MTPAQISAPEKNLHRRRLHPFRAVPAAPWEKMVDFHSSPQVIALAGMLECRLTSIDLFAREDSPLADIDVLRRIKGSVDNGSVSKL